MVAATSGILATHVAKSQHQREKKSVVGRMTIRNFCLTPPPILIFIRPMRLPIRRWHIWRNTETRPNHFYFTSLTRHHTIRFMPASPTSRNIEESMVKSAGINSESNATRVKRRSTSCHLVPNCRNATIQFLRGRQSKPRIVTGGT